MAEVGLVQLAPVTLPVAEAVLPAYRTQVSKHVFTQPQLLAVLCLMRYEDWTFREAERRLAEHQDLRAALALSRVPDYTTLHRFLCRVSRGALEQVLQAAARSAAQVIEPEREQTIVAVDGTGLATGTASTYFIGRAHNFKQRGYWRRHWVKWVLAVDVPRRLILAQLAREGPCNDSASLRPLVDAACQVVKIGRVLADAEFDSEPNHQHVREVVGAQSVIPAKRGKAEWKVQGVRAEMRERFPRELYGQRSLVESVISAAKRKLSARAPGRLPANQQKQALLLGLAFNLYRLSWRPCSGRRCTAGIAPFQSSQMRMSTEPSYLKIRLRVMRIHASKTKAS
jgi:hypothetical protein